MIELYDSEYAPSSLLNYEGIPSIINDLLHESRTYRDGYKWLEAEQRALEAKKLCQKENWQIGLALAQIHLGDCDAEVGEIGQALEQYKAAHRTLNWLSSNSRKQLQNRAVAAYALGLLNELQLFGDRVETLRRYEEALRLFKEAQEFWSAQRDQEHFNTCKKALEHIEKRVQDIRTSRQMVTGTLDVLHLESVKTPYDRDTRGYVLDNSYVEIGKTSYRLHSGTLSNNDVGDARYCFALPVGGRLKTAFSAAQDQDYVIVRLQWRLSKELANAWMPGVVWFPNIGWDVGDLTVTPASGRIWFYPQIVIGKEGEDSDKEVKDPTGAIKGYIIGLLKPDTTTPPSSSPEPPSSESSPPSEPNKTERGTSLVPEDEKIMDEKDKPTISSTHIEVLDPVWLFSDDLDALNSLLEPLGKIDISTNKAVLEKHTQVLQALPVDWLHLSVPEFEMSITFRPRQVDVRRPHEWDQSTAEANVVDHVQEFITSRRHPLHFLGKRGWQLVTAFLAIGLFLPTTFSQLVSGGVSDILKIVAFLGVLVAGILGALAFVGRYIPSRSKVTLWNWRREKFSRGIQIIAYSILGVSSIFCFGAIIGSWMRTGGGRWLAILGLMIVASAAIWFFGLSVQRVKH